jgi:hypothetical protein
MEATRLDAGQSWSNEGTESGATLLRAVDFVGAGIELDCRQMPHYRVGWLALALWLRP